MTDLEPRAIQAFRKLAAGSGRMSARSLVESDAALVEKLHLTEGTYLTRMASLNMLAPKKAGTGKF